ncbi:MAG TPA: ABC transporter permease, partial [Thermoanaerobaculia bacterium]|nr:ABC transporter permease [Thermoanaerobaculia bacterium]
MRPKPALAVVASRLAGLARGVLLVLRRPSRAAFERRLAAELEAHRRLLERGLEARGASPAEARRATRARLGDPDAVRRACRVAAGRDPEPPRGDRAMTPWLTDLRAALRALLRAPGYATAAVLTLATGIGATVALWNVADALLLRPLPFERPDRLVRLWGVSDGQPRTNSNPRDMEDWAARSRSLDGLVALNGGVATWNGADFPERVEVHRATVGLLEVLGVAPALGRGFLAEEGVRGQDGVVLLSHRFFAERLGGDPEVIDGSLELDGVARTVVGVLPAGMVHPLGWPMPAAWVPFTLAPENTSRGGHYLHGFARLADGVAVEPAQRELDAIAAQLAAEHPATNRGVGVLVEPLRDSVVGAQRRGLLILLGAVVMMMLIACANVGGLALARGLRRDRELAVRAALGASRARLARMMLAEGWLLGAAAAALGLVLARWFGAGLAALGAGRLPWAEAIALGGR